MIGSYLSILRRRWWVVAALTVALAPLLYLTLVPASVTYTSQAVVQTGSRLAEGVLGQSRPYEELESRLATELQVFHSRAVAEQAAAELEAQGLDAASPEQLREQVEVSPRGSSSLLEITGSASTPERAQAVTNAFVSSYIDYRRQIEDERLDALAEDLQAQLEVAGEELAALDEEIAAGDDSSATARAQAAAAASYQSIVDLLDDVRLSRGVDTSGVVLLSPATLPEEPSQLLNSVLVGAVSVLAALLVACGVAFLLDLFRNPVRTRAEAHAVFHGPTLGELPRVVETDRLAWLAALADPGDPTSLAARGLRLRLSGVAGGESPRTMLLTGTDKDIDEVLLVTAALAAAWGRADMRAAVVLDFDAPESRALIGDAPPEAGDALVVDGIKTVPTPLPGVSAVPAASVVGWSPGFFDASSPVRALQALSEAFDLVLLVGAGTETSEALAVSHLMDVTLLVCALGRTSSRRLQRLTGGYEEQGTTVDGMVLVTSRSRWSRSRRQRRGPGAPAAHGPAPEARPVAEDQSDFLDASTRQR